jgi:transcriptional regulator with XRE-family HTH domain
MVPKRSTASKGFVKRMTESTLDDRARRRLISWRQAAGLTQQQLGKAVGRNAVWISRYENEYFNADLDTLTRLAAAFGHSLFEMLDVSGTSIESQVTEIYRSMTMQRRRLVLGIMTELAEQPNGPLSNGAPPLKRSPKRSPKKR